MELVIEKLVEHLGYIFILAGIFIVALGGISALYSFILKEFFTKTLNTKEQFNNKDRHLFARRMILALEFFLAVDIMETVSSPTWKSLGFLGALVTIRSVLTYFLGKEVRGDI